MQLKNRLLLNAEATPPTGGAAPAAAATPNPPPAETPPSPPAPAEPPTEAKADALEDYENRRAKMLFANVEKDLGDDKEDEEGQPPKPGDGQDTPPKDKKDDLPPPPAAEPPKPKVATKKKEPVVREVVREIIREVPAPPPEQPPKVDDSVVTADDEKYVAGLNEEQRYEIEVARAAESQDPDKYKGRAKAVVKFYRDLDQFAGQGDKSEEDIEEFVKKNKPEFGKAEFRRIEREMAASEGYKRAKDEFESKKAELNRKVLRLEKDPEIKNTQKKVISDFVADLGDDPAAKLYKDKGIEEARKKFPLEAEIYEGAAQEAAMFTGEYLNMAYGITKFNPQNPVHVGLTDFIEGQCQWFKDNGGDARKRDGKDFLTRSEYNSEFKKNPDVARQKYWTLSHDDVVECLRKNIASGAKDRVKEEQEKAAKRGFVRKVEEDVPKTETPPPPIRPPAARPTPAPGGAKNEEKKPVESGIKPLSLKYSETK